MSLVNQLIAAIFAVLIGLVSGTLYIMSESSRSILQDQLESHAQDSATHLGLYLAPYMADNDSATVETAVNAIFDSGFYQRIIVTNADEAILFEKQTPPQVHSDVPLWFQNAIKITPPSMFREITYEWRQVGKIYVQSRAGYAYEKLWKGAQDSLILFVCLSLLCVLVISSLIRYLLKPLYKVENQAIALSEKRYIEQEKLPGTRELKRVVEAMNRMVRQVKSMFEEQSRNIEELRRSAYQDSLTGLNNQRATESQLAERLDYRKDFGRGHLLNIRLRELQSINQTIGVDKTNKLLKHLASLLEEMSRRADQSILGRISGSDFILLTDQTDIDKLKIQIETINDECTKQLAQLMEQHSSLLCISVGSSECFEDRNSSQLISEARVATDEAFDSNVIWKQFASAGQSSKLPDQDDWKQHVANAINRRSIILQTQSIIGSSDNQPTIQNEVFARILDRDNQPAAAGEFISVVKELGLAIELDRAVIELSLQETQKTMLPLTFNLSHEALTNDSFSNWLTSTLESISHPERLMFELDETSVLNNMSRITEFRNVLKEKGIGFGVDHFGIHPSGFAYLYSVQPDYIKIDGSLIRNLDTNAEDRFFVSSLISVAHSLGIKAYAEHVEREVQLELLTNLEVDGTQGYLHGTPTTLN